MHKCNLTDDELRAAIANHEDMIAMHGGPAFTLHTERMASALRELLDRRAAAEVESSLAYEYAESILNGTCASVSDDKDDLAIWFDVDDVCENAGDDVIRAVAYLDSRGLIYRNPKDRNLVQVCDEDEPAALPQPQLVTAVQE